MKKSLGKGKDKGNSKDVEASKSNSRAPVLGSLSRQKSGSSESAKSDRSQLVDLVVEDTEAEQVERVRARKEGGAAWNRDEPRHFV